MAPNQDQVITRDAKCGNLLNALTSSLKELKAIGPVVFDVEERVAKEEEDNKEVNELLELIAKLEVQKKEQDDELELLKIKENELLRQESQFKKQLQTLSKEKNNSDACSLNANVTKLQTTLTFLQRVTGVRFEPLENNVAQGYTVSAKMEDAKDFQFDFSEQTQQFVVDSLWSLVNSSPDSSWNSVGGSALSTKLPKYKKAPKLVPKLS